METITLILNQPEDFDELVHGGAPQASPLTIATKAAVTAGNKAGAVIAFHAEVNGRRLLVQATTTVKLLLAALRGIEAAHGKELADA